MGASKGLGLQAIMKELGWSYEVKIKVDANATIGTLHRRGLGKLRHVEVEELWLQQEISKKKVSVTKIKGVENTADIGTKPVKKEASEYLMTKMGFENVDDVWPNVTRPRGPVCPHAERSECAVQYESL